MQSAILVNEIYLICWSKIEIILLQINLLYDGSYLRHQGLYVMLKMIFNIKASNKVVNNCMLYQCMVMLRISKTKYQ
jgi:hypothetical protein